MVTNDIEGYVRSMAASVGFCDFGWVAADILQKEYESFRKYVAEGLNADMGYLAANMDKRRDPGLLVEGAKSVMVFLTIYPYFKYAEGSDLKVASYAMGADYHYMIKSRLGKIMEGISEIYPDFCGRAFTDSAPVIERAWAVRAGLGFIGKNNMFISRKYGCRTFISCIISNLPVPEGALASYTGRFYAEDPESCCIRCDKCIDACPTGALKPYRLDARKCISYQTIESRRTADDEPGVIDRHGWIFGCDECISACPWYNKGREMGWPEFGQLRNSIIEMDESSWMEMTNSEFRRRFAGTPFLRAGVKKMKDNIKNRADR